jgi:hypothetical protein
MGGSNKAPGSLRSSRRTARPTRKAAEYSDTLKKRKARTTPTVLPKLPPTPSSLYDRLTPKRPSLSTAGKAPEHPILFSKDSSPTVRQHVREDKECVSPNGKDGNGLNKSSKEEETTDEAEMSTGADLKQETNNEVHTTSSS